MGPRVASPLAYATVPETHVDPDQGSSTEPWDADASVPALTVGVVNFAVLLVYIGALFATLVLFLDTTNLNVVGFDARGSSWFFMCMTVVAAGLSVYVGGGSAPSSRSRSSTRSGSPRAT
jgi:hypothetical protein